MYSDFTQLRRAVEQNGGLLTVSMADLRDIAKAGRLGVHVRGQISENLHSEGLRHYPALLPNFQTELVRIYLVGTDVARMIEEVSNPSPEGDELILRSVRKKPGRKPGVAQKPKQRRRRKTVEQPAAETTEPSDETVEDDSPAEAETPEIVYSK